MRYVAFTICFVATLALVFFLRGFTSSPSQVEQAAQAQNFQPVQLIEPNKSAENTLAPQDINPCPSFPMPTNNVPVTGEQSKMVVKPDDKIDYKLIIIDPCLPKPEKNEKPPQQKKRKRKKPVISDARKSPGILPRSRRKISS